jgi:hypothetical protein
MDQATSCGIRSKVCRLEDIDAGVDVVRGDLVGLRLFEKAGDIAGRVRLDQPVGGRVLDRCQDNRRLRLALAMQPDNGCKVDLGEHVAVEHDHRFSEIVARVPHRPSGAERRRLDHVADRDAELRAVAEDLLDAPGLVVEAEDDLVDLRDLLQQVESDSGGTAD